MPASEFWLRLDYLGSIAWSSAALVLPLLLPDAAAVLSPAVFLTSVHYLMAMATDLRHMGHRRREVVWIYAFNLVLLPVHFAGVLKSLQQVEGVFHTTSRGRWPMCRRSVAIAIK